jgi:hypothetical protein
MENLIEKAYQTFAKYKLKEPVDVCTECCMSKSDAELLQNINLKDASKDLIYEYNTGASTELTPINEVKYFLPRFMELALNFDFPSHSSELTFRRLEQHSHDEFEIEEKHLLKEFSETYFLECLRTYPLPDYETIDNIIVMLGKGNFDLDNIFKIWEVNITLESTLHLCSLYFDGFNGNPDYKLDNPFADQITSEKTGKWLKGKALKLNFDTVIHKIIKEEKIELSEYMKNNLRNLLGIIEYNKNAI